jgi:hypothetical protein
MLSPRAGFYKHSSSRDISSVWRSSPAVSAISVRESVWNRHDATAYIIQSQIPITMVMTRISPPSKRTAVGMTVAWVRCSDRCHMRSRMIGPGHKEFAEVQKENLVSVVRVWGIAFTQCSLGGCVELGHREGTTNCEEEAR